MKNEHTILGLPPKQIFIVMLFAVVYDTLLILMGYGHYSLIGTVGLFAFGVVLLWFRKHKANIRNNVRNNWENIKQFWNDNTL